MANMQIFVVLGMGGKGTSTMNVKSTTKVSEFYQQIVDKEGAVGVRCVFRGKPMAEKRNGKELTLGDYGLYNEANVFASLRLKGGAALAGDYAQQEGNQATQFDKIEVKRFGGTITQANCILGISDGCSESFVFKCKLNCGCIYCPDCMKHNIDKQIEVGMNVNINCGNSSHGDTILDLSLAYAIAALSINDKRANDQIISENSFRRPDSALSICSNDKCKRFLMRDDNTQNKVKCDVCQKHVCWMCKEEHKGAQSMHCGNDNCDPVAYLTLLLEGAQMKKIGDVSVIDTRICPSPKCCAINTHGTACKHMTCKCGHQYCHICLGPWKGHNNSNCKVAAKQRITKDMIWSK